MRLHHPKWQIAMKVGRSAVVPLASLPAELGLLIPAYWRYSEDRHPAQLRCPMTRYPGPRTDTQFSCDAP